MKNIFIMFLSVFVILGIYAQNNKKELPGDTKLPSSDEKLEKIASYEKKEYKYSVEDFFKNTKKRYFKLSPDGKYLSYMKKNEKGKRDIYIKNTVNDKKIKVIEEGKNLIRVYFWANNNRLIYFKDKGGNENYHLFAVNIDGSDQKKLTPFDNVKVKVQKFLKEKPNSMIILMNKENSKLYNPYKINIKTGELNKLYDNDKSSNPITSYDFDKEGNLRGYFKKIDGIKTVYYYRETKNKPFKKIIQTDWDEEFKTIGFDYSTDYKHDVFVLTNLFKNTKEIIKYDLKKKKIINYKFSNEKYDLKGISRSRKRDYVIDYYYYTAKKSKKVPVSQSYKKLHKKFTNKFGEYQFFIVDRTKKEDKYLLFVRSDKLYGAYYQYDRKKDSFKKLARLFPHLKEKDMAEMKSIKFESRDGLTIHGYITIPEEAKKGKKVPLIVNPHGGPYGIRDSWRFDPKAQLFASRGYATLQINYRGSGGYGK